MAQVILFLLFALVSPHAATGCDASLWRHVYKPARLTVIEPCVAVRGVVVDATATRKHPSKDGVRHEGDGDTHGWVRLDPGFEDLLDAGNRSDEGGNLVFEAVCQFRVTQADAKTACRSYHSSVVLPPVGSHVEILGAYVEDSNHGHWREIHPVTRIVVLPHR